MKLLGANRAAKVTALDELPGKSNYFIGNDPKKWRTDVPTYTKVKYEGVYPGIDLIYYGNQRQFEYDFVVAPGSDPKAITLAVGAGLSPPDGAQQAAPLRVDASGDLVVEAEGGEVRFHKPVVYQEQPSVVSRQFSVAKTSLRYATDHGPRTTDKDVFHVTDDPLPGHGGQPDRPFDGLDDRPLPNSRRRAPGSERAGHLEGHFVGQWN